LLLVAYIFMNGSTVLTDRQAQILKAVIEEHIETGEPVGSEVLDKKYSMGISPATIRNEMAVLVKEGFLEQPHTSAGRLPTPMALKFYIKQLMDEKELSVADEVAVKERVWDYRYKMDKLLREATRALAEKTKSVAIAATNQGDVYHAGYANILDLPEFFDIDVTKTLLSIIDDFKQLDQVFAKALGDDPIHVLLGTEMGVDFLDPCGMVFTDFGVEDKIKGRLGVIGPCRLDYPYIVPIVRYFGNLVNEFAQDWA